MITTYILIGGPIYSAPDEGKAFCEVLTNKVHHRPIKILNCLFGRSEESWNERSDYDQKFFEQHLDQFTIELAQRESFVQQISVCDVVFFQGGIPQNYLSYLQNIENWVPALQGKIVVGSSAGADILVRYYGVGQTLAIREGLGLISKKFIPHWKSDYGKGLVIDWENLRSKLEAHGDPLEIITLSDGEFKVVEE